MRERKRHTDRGVSSTTQVGYPPARSDRGGTRGGIPPCWGPPARSEGEYPRWGPPQPGLMGVPPGQVQWGVPKVGYSPIRVPPSQVWWEGTQGGVPPSGYPPPTRSNAGRYLRWGTPCQGTPLGRSDGGVPEVGYPWPCLTGGYPRWSTPPPTWTWLGYLPCLDLAGVPPPPGVDRQMERHESKHNLPVVLRTRSVINYTFINWFI